MTNSAHIASILGHMNETLLPYRSTLLRSATNFTSSGLRNPKERNITQKKLLDTRSLHTHIVNICQKL